MSAKKLTVLPPSLTRVSDDTVAVNTCLTPENIASAIEADIERFERSSREAAFSALRIGLSLIFIRDTGERGALMRFIREHFSKGRERTLMRYIGIAESFAKEAGLVERKSKLLTNGDAIAPILETQLELFTDPKAKFDGAMKKLVKWVGERGLADLYAQKTKLAAAKGAKRLSGPVEITKTLEDEKAEAKDELSVWINGMDSWFLAEHHTRITSADRALTQTALEMALKKLKEVRA